jgi:NAD(P)-dependent dehydrogenase (short-subunit alcohol dehydrogenase family)
MNTVLVTGANKGIGFEIARNIGKRGYHVLVGARNEQRGLAAVEQLRAEGLSADFLQLDVVDLKSIDAAAKLVAEKYPNLNLLVNNAGIPGYPMYAAGWEFDAATLEQTWRTNFLGPFELIKKLLNTLKANHGKILNVSIPIEPMPFFNAFAYQTAKAPLNVMTKSFAMVFEKENIPVEILTVTPGAVSTDLNGHIQGSFVKTPEQAAALIVGFAFDGQKRNGQVINHDGVIANYSAGKV